MYLIKTEDIKPHEFSIRRYRGRTGDATNTLELRPPPALQGLMNVWDLFEHTYLGTTTEVWQAKYWIEAQCWKQNYIALIDWDPEDGWIFHTLITLVENEGIKIERPEAERFRVSSWWRREGELENHVVQYLIRQGHQVQQQVKCAVGYADIVTPDYIFEIKGWLKRSTVYEALGQVLLYRQALNTQATCVIVGYEREPQDELFKYVRELGVIIWPWPITKQQTVKGIPKLLIR